MNRTRLFIAEDFPMQIELLHAMFDDDNRFETTFFTDGLELYLSAVENSPQLLVLDIILPTLSGLAITRLLKFDERYRDIPILVTSSITDKNIKENALKAGADYFLPKPFKPSDLFDGIMSIIK